MIRDDGFGGNPRCVAFPFIPYVFGGPGRGQVCSVSLNCSSEYPISGLWGCSHELKLHGPFFPL